ncbi:tetratricopeptide repeat protein [Paraflavitalea speifideaquila]|uniref:tetratricopeptide repeat protein n=1 Tax=Paraflavitalea speifideaquila TaxID=3076558 RepID=UPI0028E25835|nr:tetratricopeptide repeat protein [Paraflavitalea speifideiaquila]
MKKTTVIFGLLGLSHFSIAQQTRFIDDPQASYKQAKEYFQREQYSLAYPLLKDLALKQREPDITNQAIPYQEIKYYTIVCALKQNEKGAVEKAKNFIDLEDNEVRTQMMGFHLAEYYFRQQNYPEAIPLYEHADIANLTNREIADMKFHLGYAYFTNKQFDKAKPMFDAIRQMKDDPNYIDANYYYGFLSFYDKNTGMHWTHLLL